MGNEQDITIAVIGLGYVGLPVALALSRCFPKTIGFDAQRKRVDALLNGYDTNGDVSAEELKNSPIKFTFTEEDLAVANFFIVAVPTPIDEHRKPDLTALRDASCLVGRVISRGSVVVYESTVYPGVTEEFCGPIIELESGLEQGKDFKLGYSPERINPGDREHTLEHVIKVVSGQDNETLEKVASVYCQIIKAGVHRVSSIRVAEAAKVIENTQRDLNIALMNELAVIFDRLGISTKEVLDAASTKWNFLRFMPGLVGGHCIGVDPYYLTSKAEQLGYRPQVILAGRRINDGMGQFIAQKTVKLMARSGIQIKGARVGILGLTFKENVSDIRNSRVPSIVAELQDYRVECLVHDPVANSAEAMRESNISLLDWDQLTGLDALIITVAHRSFAEKECAEYEELLNPGGVIIDVKWLLDPNKLGEDKVYWSL